MPTCPSLSPSSSSLSTDVAQLAGEVTEALQQLGFTCESQCRVALTDCHLELKLRVPDGVDPPSVKRCSVGKNKSWTMNYAVLSFLMSGQLFADYNRLSTLLGLPPCSESQWRRIIEWMEGHVTHLAELSCEQARDRVRERGDQDRWIASYDGFYLTRGHYSNNSSATLHDFASGNITWFRHRTKRGDSHNWEGTSCGAESDMLEEILREVKETGFTISEMVTDKDSSVNSIYCQYFPEGTITYCSNHCAKTLHKELQQLKQTKCKVHR